MRFMKTLGVAVAAAWSASCGPEVDEDTPLGELVYSDTIEEIYRLDRRIEVVAVDPVRGLDGCGYLTDRAYDDLEMTIAALDPSKDYVADPERCEAIDEVYIEGFEHSPFACDWTCCNLDLAPVATVYFAILQTLSDKPPNIEGEDYIALDPGRPCD